MYARFKSNHEKNRIKSLTHPGSLSSRRHTTWTMGTLKIGVAGQSLDLFASVWRVLPFRNYAQTRNALSSTATFGLLSCSKGAPFFWPLCWYVVFDSFV
jgi:hypothetical protein